MKIKSGYLPHKLQNFRQLSPAHPLYVVHTLFPYCEHVATRSTHGFVVVGIIPKYRNVFYISNVFVYIRVGVMVDSSEYSFNNVSFRANPLAQSPGQVKLDVDK